MNIDWNKVKDGFTTMDVLKEENKELKEEIKRLNNIIKQQNTRNSRQRIANRKLLERNQDLVIENLKLNNIINKIEEHFVFLKIRRINNV